jgi:protocatechuate 3,4-dioxygenase beta subunit
LSGEEIWAALRPRRGLFGTVHNGRPWAWAWVWIWACGAAGGRDEQKARRRARDKARASMVTPSDDSGLLLLRLIEDR